MGFSDAEAYGSEDTGDIRRVVLFQPLLGKRAAVHQPLQAVHTHDIGFGLFQPRIRRAYGLADIHLLAIPVSKVRSQTVRNLVHHGGGKIAFARRLGRLLRLHDLAGERQDDVIHPRVHKVLEEDFLGAFRLMNTRIVGQIVGHRLVAVAQVAGAEGRVHHLHGREVAAFGGTVFGLERQRILNIGNIFLEDRQLLALSIIAHQHRRAIGGLYPENVVQISFIRRHDHIEFWVFEVKPGKVTLVIIVAQQGIGAQPQETGERGIITECRCLTQFICRRLQERTIGNVVGNAFQFLPFLPDHGIATVDLSLFVGMVFYILLQLLVCNSRRIESASG